MNMFYSIFSYLEILTNYCSNGKDYISPDGDKHIGGVWKKARTKDGLNSKSTRLGTYDEKLNRIGD